MVAEVFLHSKAELAGSMLATVFTHSYEFHSVGACDVMTSGTEENIILGLLMVCRMA